jgi:nitrate reductase NapE component
MVDDDEKIKESKMSKTLTILFWPIPFIAFVGGVINGFYKAIIK